MCEYLSLDFFSRPDSWEYIMCTVQINQDNRTKNVIKNGGLVWKKYNLLNFSSHLTILK